VRSQQFNAREWERELDSTFDRLKRLPEDADLGRAGARACYELAVQLYEQGFRESIRAARTAREVCDKLSDAGTFDEEDRLLRVEARLLLGRSAVDRRRFADAAEHYKQALDDLDDCTSGKREVALKKAEVYHRQGEMYNAQPDRRLAVDAYEESIRLRKQLTSHRKYSETAAQDYFNDLARGYGYLGDTLLDLGEPDRAEKAYNASEVIRAALQKEFPRSSRARQQLARSHWNTGQLRLRQNKGPEAITALSRAVETFQDLVDSSDGHVAEFREDLAYTSLDLAEALLDFGTDSDQRRRAEECARMADKQFGELLQADPNASSLLRDRVRARLDLLRCQLTATAGEAHKQDALKQLDTAERKLRELEERKEGREEPTTSYLMAVLESMRGEVTPDPMKRGLCLVNVSNRLGEAIKNGFANAEQMERDVRLRLFREQRSPDLRILVEKCRTTRRSGMDR
jgi:tetratricopeptide (TPR) repeat protein